MKISPILRFLIKFLIHKSCHNFKSSNNAKIKLESLSQLEKRNTMMTKAFDEKVMFKIYDVILLLFMLFFRFKANFEKSRSRFPDA